MTNYTKITGHLYKALNQNGLNNALYEYFDVYENNNLTKKI